VTDAKSASSIKPEQWRQIASKVQLAKLMIALARRLMEQ
jgi:hypothetical protein